MASSTCAAQAAALGANVRCYEPTPFFVDAIQATASLNGPSFGARLKVTHARPTLDPCVRDALIAVEMSSDSLLIRSFPFG